MVAVVSLKFILTKQNPRQSKQYDMYLELREFHDKFCHHFKSFPQQVQ